jgi:ribonuclease HII
MHIIFAATLRVAAFLYPDSVHTKMTTIHVCGVDEAGRGPLVGNVVAAAVVLPPEGLDGLRDSKKLSAKRREVLYNLICEKALAYGVGIATPAEIDELNILQATFLAMRRAIESVTVTLSPLAVLVDGNRLPDLSGLPVVSASAIVKGDDKEPAISAASILAKVTRDRQMAALHHQFPQYNFAKHQGYPTPEHLAALREFGACPAHRATFGPVRSLQLSAGASPV